MTEQPFRDFILAELKCAALRSRLMTAEIESINTALRGNLINPDEAVVWAGEAGVRQFMRLAIEEKAATA